MSKAPFEWLYSIGDRVTVTGISAHRWTVMERVYIETPEGSLTRYALLREDGNASISLSGLLLRKAEEA